MDKRKINYSNVRFCLRCGGPMQIRADREGKIRPVCQACGWVYYKNPIPAVAVLVLNEQNELLLVKRLFEPNAGEWALPSGYMEINLSPQENAIEEMREETGLEGEVDHFIDWYFGYSPIYERVLSLGFRMRIRGGKLQAGDDASEAKFFPLETLPRVCFAAHRKFIHLETGLELEF
ncbi:MAG: NUDIX hydrolase [Candidatus Syntrophosphaera sp.]|nr:NUDIX hydrolase [Candidatus Syntrophosphaera sp.]